MLTSAVRHGTGIADCGRPAAGVAAAWLAAGLTAKLGYVALVALALGGCASGSSQMGGKPSLGTTPSARVATYGERIPKGGGTVKVGAPYSIEGRWYVPRDEPGYDRVGVASWYGLDFHGRKTANGEIYDMDALSAAHPTLPLPSYAYVTNTANGRTILVRINDRGPYAKDRIIDLSQASARALGFDRQGLTDVRVRYAGPAPLDGDDRRERQFLAQQSQPPMNVARAARPEPRGDVTAALPSGLAWRR